MALVQGRVPRAVPESQLFIYGGHHTASWGPDFASPRGEHTPKCGAPLGASCGIRVPRNAGGPSSGRRMILENIWREFFEDPSQWWDHRLEKDNPRYPDFKHKITQESLWLVNPSNPPWVEDELASVAPGILQSNIFSWNKRLHKHIKAGKFKEAMELFQQLQREHITPNKLTFVSVLNACASLRALEDGKGIHAQIMHTGFDSEVYLANCLVNMYVKCGSMEEAQGVFNKMPMPDVVSWNSMIQGYVKCGDPHKGLDLFRQMQENESEPDHFTFVGVLNACAIVGALEEGRQVHEQVIQRGYETDVFVGSSLINMYAKCESTEDARRVFNKMPTRDVVAWSAMILGYAKSGEGRQALELFQQMHRHGVEPSRSTFIGMLKACASIGALEEGRHFHEQITRRGYDSDDVVGSCLVDMYAKCGSIEDAQTVFNKMSKRNVVAWTAMILGYVKCGEGQKALKLSGQMQREGVEPDLVTFVGILNACASVEAVEEGRRVHEQVIERGYMSDVFVGSSLIDMYAKCGSIEEARKVFNEMTTRSVVSWNALIMGYVRCGEGQTALEISQEMHRDGVDPDPFTFVGLLNACASVVAFAEGVRVHKQIIRRGYESNVYIGSCLVDMYAKCGSIEEARRVFDKMPARDVCSWTAMLAGYAMHGHAKEALEHFELMCGENVEVNGVTFISLLSACSHGGLVDEGLNYFESMGAVYNIVPRVGHYSCVVDLLGRAGRLCEAEDLIRSMPCDPTANMWKSLLAACRLRGDVDMGERVAKLVTDLDPASSAGYVLLSNMYAAAQQWDSSVNIHRERLENLQCRPEFR